MSHNRCLLTISLYGFTGEDWGDLRGKQRCERHAWKWMPEYCILDDGRIYEADAWLQFVDDGKEVFYLFSVEHAEQPLAEEISNCGLEDLIKDACINFTFLKQLPYITYKNMTQSLNGNVQLVIDVVYSGGAGWMSADYCDDFSLEIDLVGYLDPITKELIKIENNE